MRLSAAGRLGRCWTRICRACGRSPGRSGSRGATWPRPHATHPARSCAGRRSGPSKASRSSRTPGRTGFGATRVRSLCLQVVGLRPSSSASVATWRRTSFSSRRWVSSSAPRVRSMASAGGGTADHPSRNLWRPRGGPEDVECELRRPRIRESIPCSDQPVTYAQPGTALGAAQRERLGGDSAYRAGASLQIDRRVVRFKS